MSLTQTLFELAQKNPDRKPGSDGLAAIFTEIKKTVDSWGVNPQLQKIPVYKFRMSLLVFVAGSIGAVLLSMVGPGWGLILALGLYWMFLREMVRPFLAKAHPASGENLQIQIPARSKENQKIILTANVSTDSFFEPEALVSSRLYVFLVYGLGLLIPICLFLYWRLRESSILFFTVLPILLLVFFAYSRKTSPPNSNLDKAAVLLELGSILLKSPPLSTSITLILTGANSLNSGILPVLQSIKSSPSTESEPLTYVISLTDLPDKRINIVTADGELISRPNEPLLIEFLMEISREKKIPTQEIKLQQFTETYPLKFKKMMTVSVTHPQNQYIGENANRDLRELLLGLIRKLD